ncbi:MAG: AMIN domain-containing protein [Deltaproteobacteria bacterium]|nr:AMIN domain-containing protein [Deltaproteobacteria bacterium]
MLARPGVRGTRGLSLGSATRVAVVGLLLAAPWSPARAEDKLSRLAKVQVEPGDDQVTVLIQGSRAPNFTSFTMEDPFRVVVDWAGSQVGDAPAETTFERGLVRKVQTQQFNSEAEKISRVVLHLAQRTTYRVQARGTTVEIQLDPVPDPLPAPEPDPVLAEVEAEDLAPVPPMAEGPLTEPDVPVPAAPPAPPAVVAEAKVPVVDDEPVTVAVVDAAPAPKIAPASKTAPAPKAAPAPVVAAAPRASAAARAGGGGGPAPVVVAESAAARAGGGGGPPAPKPAPSLDVPAPVVADAPKPAPVVVAEAPAPKPAAAPAPAPAAKPAEPVRLATFTPEVKPVPETKVTMTAPPAAPARRTEPRPTAVLASNVPAPAGSGWQPPGVGNAGRPRSLPVVKVASPQETLQPEASLPADPDEEVRTAKPPPSLPVSADADDFDPGPRQLKYIGFRQMAGLSRVFVRMDGKARYRQYREGDTFILELVDSSVPVKNNTRPLDTSYFNGPVSRVQAVPSGDNTRVEVKLRESVPFTVKRIGTTIAVDFSHAQ